MKLFGLNISRNKGNIVIDTQIRDSWDSPFQSTFDSYQPFKQNMDLFKVIREALPVADIGIIKWTRLLGDFRIDAQGNQRLQDVLEEFKDTITVGWFDRGFLSFQERLFDSGLESGMGIGELVPEKALNGINRLKVADPKIIRFVKKDGQLQLGQVTDNNFTVKAFESPEYITYFGPDKRVDNPQGFSLFWGLPFISQIWQRITKSIENQVWRLGSPTFVSWIEGGEALDPPTAKQLQSELK